MKKVLVSICNTGNVKADLINLPILLGQEKEVMMKIVQSEIKPYQNNLNVLAKRVLDDGYDYWLNLDSDVVPNKNPLELVKLDKDVIFCPYPQWNNVDKFPIYWVAMDKVADGYKPVQFQDGMVEVDAVATGCTLIHRRVLEKIKAPFERIWNEDGIQEKGIDFNFCDKVKENDFKIYANFDYYANHYKSLNLVDVLSYFNQMLNK